MALLAGALAVLVPVPAHAWELPSAAQSVAPALRAAGQGRLTFLGFQVYDAKLWVEPGFRQAAPDGHHFALELSYLRDFTGADIARRSIDEMRRADNFDDATAKRWQDQLRQLLPDVKAGDRILGLHRPGKGALFLFNGKPAGEIADARFARNFFAIWLGPKTSEPAMRQQLLTGTAP